MNKRFLLAVALLWQAAIVTAADESRPPLQLAIVGLTHGHVKRFVTAALTRPGVQVVGIVEPRSDLSARCAKDNKLPESIFYRDLEQLLKARKVDAVAIFTSTFEHRKMVEICAAHGVHAMMEKPLAVNMDHARAMETAARKGGIQVIVNFETTWFPAYQAAYALIHDQHAIGDIRKIVGHDGHRGPIENRSPPEFLEWLTDPVLNGGGAVMDFGGYGAGLMTWLMDGQRPTSVFAVVQRIKPDVYKNVDDEATIVLTYPHAQGIIQASWNWPYARKDLEIYGQTGAVIAPNRNVLRRRDKAGKETESTPPPPAAPFTDALSYLTAVATGKVQPSGPSSLATNLIVTEILDAARESARTGKRVDLDHRHSPTAAH